MASLSSPIHASYPEGASLAYGDLVVDALLNQGLSALADAEHACDATDDDIEAHQQAENAKKLAEAAIRAVRDEQSRVGGNPKERRESLKNLGQKVTSVAQTVSTQSHAAIALAEAHEAAEGKRVSSPAATCKKSVLASFIPSPTVSSKEEELTKILEENRKRQQAKQAKDEKEKQRQEERDRAAHAIAAAALAHESAPSRFERVTERARTILRRGETAAKSVGDVASAVWAMDEDAIMTKSQVVGRGARRSLERLGLGSENAQAIAHEITDIVTTTATVAVKPLIGARKAGTLAGMLVEIVTGDEKERSYHLEQLDKARERNFNWVDDRKERDAARDSIGLALQKALEILRKDPKYVENKEFQARFWAWDTDKDHRVELHELRAAYEAAGGSKGTSIRGRPPTPPPSMDAILAVLTRDGQKISPAGH